MQELQIFNNPEFGQIRTTEIDGEPFFVGKDVAEALGYSNTNDALARHCKGVVKRYPLQTDGGKQEVRIISEGDMYRLIASSKLEGAQKFESWIFDEVVPSIRKHGVYATPVTIDNIINNPDFGIQLLQKLKEDQQKLAEASKQIAAKSKVIEELQPKASYYDLVLQCSSLLSTTMIAKDYGMSAKHFNQLLRDKGIQFSQSGRWFLYAKYDGNGYVQSKTSHFIRPDGTQGTATNMYWTQKGRLFIYETLKSDGIVPEIEKTEEGEKDNGESE